LTQEVAHILKEAKQLCAPDRADLAVRLVESLAYDIPTDIAAAQISEIRQRIVQVESGEVVLIPGKLIYVRELVASTQRVS